MEKLKTLRAKEILGSTVLIVIFSSLLLAGLVTQNKNAVVLTIIVLSLPSFISEVIFKSDLPFYSRIFSHAAELQAYEKEQMGDRWKSLNEKKPAWMWALILVVIVILYVTDIPDSGGFSSYHFLFLFSVGLASSIYHNVQQAKKVDRKPDVAAFMNRLAVLCSVFGILVLFFVITLVNV